MRLPIGFAVISCFLLGIGQCPAQVRTFDALQRYNSRDVILLTTSAENESREMLKALEETACFFAKGGLPEGLLAQKDASEPVKIFAFASKDEYVNFRLTSGSFGHYIHSDRGDFIVLQDVSPKHREAGLHEYTHAVLRRAGLKLPVWLNEGLADVYSTLSAEGDHVVVGRQIASRVKALERHAWLTLPVLMQLSDEHSLYRSSEQTSLFYGESWALTHMLAFSPRYAPGFPSFLKTVGSGIPVLQALTEIYGADLGCLNSDLQRYWQEGHLRGVSIKMKIDAPGQPLRDCLDSRQSSLELANLLAAAPATVDKAADVLLALRKQLPDDPQVTQQLEGLNRGGTFVPGITMTAFDQRE